MSEEDWTSNLYIDSERRIQYTMHEKNKPVEIPASELEEMYQKATTTHTYYQGFACRVIAVYSMYFGNINDFVV